MTSTDDILRLVRIALDEFEDRTLEESIRRTVRVANLLGDEKTAIRLGLELRPVEGNRSANAEDIRRLVRDKERWTDPTGPAERAIAEYIEDRRIVTPVDRDSKIAGNLIAHSIGEIEFWQKVIPVLSSGDEFAVRLSEVQALLRARHRCFTALCQWERQLTYANVNERIFTRFQDEVDALLSTGAPELLAKFSSVYRRLRDAAVTDPVPEAGEELTQALTTCRRILEAVADHVYAPDRPLILEDGTQADPSKYRARLKEFTKEIESDTYREAIDAEISGLYERFRATDKLASKAVHADVALEEAEVCAILTYVLAGEILRLQQLRGEGSENTVPSV